MHITLILKLSRNFALRMVVLSVSEYMTLPRNDGELFHFPAERFEKAAWLSSKNVAQNFLANKKSPQYKQVVTKITLFALLSG